MKIVTVLAIVLYLAGLLYLTGFGVDSAAANAALIPFALPAALVLILAMRLLGLRRIGRRMELVGWAVFTVWLGTTYVVTSPTVMWFEVVVLVGYVGLALLGVAKSPYFLAVAWLLHPVWDFVPRELPALLTDLPTACILFDVPIGIYLVLGAATGRWRVLASRVETDSDVDLVEPAGSLR